MEFFLFVSFCFCILHVEPVWIFWLQKTQHLLNMDDKPECHFYNCNYRPNDSFHVGPKNSILYNDFSCSRLLLVSTFLLLTTSKKDGNVCHGPGGLPNSRSNVRLWFWRIPCQKHFLPIFKNLYEKELLLNQLGYMWLSNFYKQYEHRAFHLEIHCLVI